MLKPILKVIVAVAPKIIEKVKENPKAAIQIAGTVGAGAVKVKSMMEERSKKRNR